MTSGVADLERQGTLFPAIYLRRHLNGDWGDLEPEDRQANDAALRDGDRLFSSYKVTPTLNFGSSRRGSQRDHAAAPGRVLILI